MPLSLAKWFSVPSGITPSEVSESTNAAATLFIVPSPPAATTTSAPRATAARMALGASAGEPSGTNCAGAPAALNSAAR